MQYYANVTEYGPRQAVALTLGVPLEEVELGYDGIGFFIVRPEGANPDPAEVAAQTPPVPEPPAPLTDVDIDLDRITKILAGYEAEAPQRITRLKAEVSLAMIGFAGFNPVSANAEGSRFVVHHASKIAAFNLAGGNVVAGQALYDEIAESTKKFPWLNQEMGDGQPKILSIFLTRLIPK